ncbi:MAG TPA: M23 family metallopeptidase [Acidimicrobiia bacterium]|nr:M23 family metallopeptidase [Acidimicrobiia bacterium]
MDSRGNNGSRVVTASLTALVLLASLIAQPAPATAQTDGFDPSRIVFPVIGNVTFIDDFHQPRSGGRMHEATDIMGPKMLPVVAAADGVVRWIGSSCCYLSIDHGGGWETWYIHLNNDTPGTDDGQAWGIAPGIERGTQVYKGQLIGWVGDSGNAEWTAPHLHFQIFHNDVAVNPYQYLISAPRLTAPTPRVSTGTFTDDDGSVHEADIEKLVASGITKGCSTEPSRYCPSESITRGQIAAFINRALSLAPTEVDWFADDNGTPFEADINAIMSAGIGFGCDPSNYCSDRPLLRQEMATLLVRAFNLAPSDVDWFVDDDNNAHQADINALASAGVTIGCAVDPARYCATDTVTRAQMASFFVRAMGL